MNPTTVIEIGRNARRSPLAPLNKHLLERRLEAEDIDAEENPNDDETTYEHDGD